MALSEKKQIEHDLLYKSLIGKEIEIIDSKNKKQIGLKGILVYESANMLILEVKGKIVKILKGNVVLKADYKGKALNMDGRLLLGTLINRLKKMR